MKTWSVIICSIDAGKFTYATQCYERLLSDRPFEIIGIHDAKSLCEGYNRGVARARGDILVFSHDDILIIDPGFANKIEARLTHYDLIGFAGTTKLVDGYWWASGTDNMRGAVAHVAPGERSIGLFVYGVENEPICDAQAIDGLCMITRADVLKRQTFDAETFDGFHLYDLDFSLRVHLSGMKVGVMSDSPILHMSAGKFNATWQHYRERFVRKHAKSLGFDATQPIPSPTPMQARCAAFANVSSMLTYWKTAHLQRATLAFRSTHNPLSSQNITP